MAYVHRCSALGRAPQEEDPPPPLSMAVSHFWPQSVEVGGGHFGVRRPDLTFVCGGRLGLRVPASGGFAVQFFFPSLVFCFAPHGIEPPPVSLPAPPPPTLFQYIPSKARLLLKEKPPHGGGGSEAKKVCVPKIGLKFPAPLIIFIFCRRKSFLMWVGGWVGRGWPGPQTSPPAPQPRGSLRYSLSEAVTSGRGAGLGVATSRGHTPPRVPMCGATLQNVAGLRGLSRVLQGDPLNVRRPGPGGRVCLLLPHTTGTRPCP